MGLYILGLPIGELGCIIYPQDLPNLMVVGPLWLDCQTIFPTAGCSYKLSATGIAVRLTGGSRAGIRGGFIGGRLAANDILFC